ncbi:MAG: PadR family transcriptional regulator [Candidatus Thorarchaeota archaeon]
METSEQVIAGPLQARVLVTLRDEPTCGVGLMDRLVINSPGTIYPVLDSLRRKQLVECRTEEEGAKRRKVYSLTQFGEEQLHEYLTSMVSVFCNDMHTHIDKIIESVEGLLKISPHQRILCTLDYENIRHFFRGTNVTISQDLSEAQGSYDTILSFLGVGCILRNDVTEISEYVKLLGDFLEIGGTLVSIEIEKTGNIFARFFFEHVFGLETLPGLKREELKSIIESTGFHDTRVISRDGLLLAFCSK